MPHHDDTLYTKAQCIVIPCYVIFPGVKTLINELTVYLTKT